MAVTPTPVFPQSIISSSCQITASQTVNTTTPLALVTAGTNGSKIDAFWITSSASAVQNVNIFSGTAAGTQSAGVGLIGALQVPATAGATHSVPAVDVLRSTQNPQLPYDAFGNKIIYLAPSQVLAVEAVTLPASGTVINFFATGANF